ncbi:MAG: 6-carboxytetrahydropterin synthase QueD [Vampirovibrionia bacterium]
MFEVMIEDNFAAAHRLLNYQGVCENQHGHNWKVQVYVQGDQLDNAGILIDFKVISNALQLVLNELDHTDLNSLEAFNGLSPSSELIAKYIYAELTKTISGVVKVSIWETDKSKASYWE